MSGIGGLDVTYGARHQIVRTNVAVVHTGTTTFTEAQCNAAFDLLHQGLSHTILCPDFIYVATDKNAAAYTDAAMFHVDTTGNGSVDSAVVSKGNILRDDRQVPLTPNSSPAPTAATTAQNTVLPDVAASGTTLGTSPSSNLVLEAVLNTGVMEFTNATAGASAFGAVSDATQSDATEALLGVGEFSSAIYSAALAQSATNIDAAADTQVAGTPEGQVSLLDLSGMTESLMDSVNDGAAATLAALNIASSTEVKAVLNAHATTGRVQATAGGALTANFQNLMSADSAAFPGSLGICSVISIAKVL